MVGDLLESPVWDDRRGALWYVDIPTGRVLMWTPLSGAIRTWSFGAPLGSLALCDDGTLVLAGESSLRHWDPDTDTLRVIARVTHAAPGDRMNDSGCDPQGRLWTGSISASRTPTATLYRLDEQGLVPVLTGVTNSNGLDWSEDGRLMYYVDTATRRIDVFDFEATTGAITHRRPFVAIDPADGKPDGLTVDAEGHLWVALWGGGCVHRYAPDGSRDRVLPVPVPNPTSVAFGGPDLEDLYVTAAASHVWHFTPGVRGRVPRRIRGCVVSSLASL